MVSPEIFRIDHIHVSLFGYYNSIERRFEATELVRALYQMSKDDVHQQQMMMVLLDEMNLAHPEQYFADLLSKLETCRGMSECAQYDILLGGGERPEHLDIGGNILWTGTMNEDETTKGLSDKVIDRSTLITFPRPTELYGRKQIEEIKPEFVLSKKKWNQETVLRQYIDSVKDGYDYVLLDCRPSLGMLVINALSASDYVLVPVQAEYFAAEDMTELLGTVRQVKRQINPKLEVGGIFLTMANDTNFRKDVVKAIKENYKRHFINMLRFDERYGGILKNRSSMAGYCYGKPEGGFDGNYCREWVAIPFTAHPLTGLTHVCGWSDIWRSRKAARTVGKSSAAI